MTPTDRAAVNLREITAETVIAVIKLAVAEHQQRFVAPNAVSLAQALFAPEAWVRAICRGAEPVGFVMLADESLRRPMPERPTIGVWRLMVAAPFQGQGIGRAAMQQVVEHARAKGLFDALELSFVPGVGSPEPFYLSLGFRHTGRVDDGEQVLELPLRPDAGQRPGDQDRPPIRLRGLDHLVLRVQDLERMLRFYVDVLGCSVERRQEALGLVQLRAGASLIDLVPVDGELGRAGGAAPGTEGRNLDHFCLRVEAFDAAAIRRRLAACGVAAGEAATRYGAEGFGASIYCTDPEGNVVELKGPPDPTPPAPGG